MAKDPAFLFYPGDYLRDTQCLSEKVQVAYDRIMCEHMRNICISQAQLNFFTKKLNSDEKEELLMVLTQVEGGYKIDWVVESINKRKAYSESRSKNRSKKHMKTYVNHMENENEIENVNKDKVENRHIPKKEEFMQFVKERCVFLGLKYEEHEELASAKYDAWVENGWKDLKGAQISRWKSKVISNIPFFRKPLKSPLNAQSGYLSELEEKRRNFKPIEQ